MCKRMVKNLGMIVTGTDVNNKTTYQSICTTKTHHLVEQKVSNDNIFGFTRTRKEVP